jgi:hypothetical protein
VPAEGVIRRGHRRFPADLLVYRRPMRHNGRTTT